MKWRRWTEVTSGFTAIRLPDGITGEVEIFGKFVEVPQHQSTETGKIFRAELVNIIDLVARVSNAGALITGYLTLRGNKKKFWFFVSNG